VSDDPIRVSVVLPFLNAERFLRESVESVLAQTYPHWELLLVDDGSADGSTAVAREYARRDPGRVRYLAHPGHQNRGISASRNLGIRASGGEFVALLDADDVWLPEKLERHVPQLAAHPEAGMLYGDTLYWYGWTGDAADRGRDYRPPLGVPRGAVVDGRGLLLRQLAGEAESPCTCSVLSRRAVVERVGGFEDAFRGMHEDQVFYAKMLLEAPAFVADGCFERYRRYRGESDSVTAAHAEPQALAAARLAYLDWLAGHLAARGLAGSELQRIVDDARRACRGPRARAWRALARRGARAVAAALGVGTPRPGAVRFGHLRRTRPINRHWGWERGQPVDRFYIERFLARHAGDVRGRVLEAGDDAYTRRFGGGRVTRRDVLHVHAGDPAATVVADLASADHVPSDAFDCIILTQTLHLVYDVRAAMRTLHRILRPGGTLLATAPGISQTTDDSWRESWYWALTAPSMRRLALECFPADRVEVESHGNVLAAVAFLHGLAREELRPAELAAADGDFPVVVALRARKPPA
jgi:SAM-dependent methyltransferase